MMRKSTIDIRLAAAIARGVAGRPRLLAAEGGSLSADQAAVKLGLSKQAVVRPYHMGQMVGWRKGKRKALRFPAWQFLGPKILAGLKETSQVMIAGGGISSHWITLPHLADSLKRAEYLP